MLEFWSNTPSFWHCLTEKRKIVSPAVEHPASQSLNVSDLSRSHRVWAVVLAFLGLLIGVDMAANSVASTTWALGLLLMPMMPPKRWDATSMSRSHAGLAKVYAVTWIMAINTGVAYLSYTLIALI